MDGGYLRTKRSKLDFATATVYSREYRASRIVICRLKAKSSMQRSRTHPKGSSIAGAYRYAVHVSRPNEAACRENDEVAIFLEFHMSGALSSGAYKVCIMRTRTM